MENVNLVSSSSRETSKKVLETFFGVSHLLLCNIIVLSLLFFTFSLSVVIDLLLILILDPRVLGTRTTNFD